MSPKTFFLFEADKKVQCAKYTGIKQHNIVLTLTFNVQLLNGELRKTSS